MPEFRDAILSDDREHRLVLTRSWIDGTGPTRTVTFVGLNPSTADASNDDMTVTKCRGFAVKWGCNAFHVVNLYSRRCTKPAKLKTLAVLNDARNDRAIIDFADVSDLVVACWGAWAGPDPLRADAVRELVGDRWHALGFTAEGGPRHPSRIGYDAELVRWPLHPGASAAPLEDLRDVCENCGHLRSSHRPLGGCTAFVPGQPLKSVDSRLSPVERVTAINVTSKGRAHAKEWTSSVCPCRSFTASGLRFMVDDDPQIALAVREGRARRTLMPIAEL